MDTLDLFLKRFSYKFPKGYPDMDNPDDTLLLENILESLDIFLNEEDTKGEATLFEAALVKAWYELNNKPMPKNSIPEKDEAALTPQMIDKAKNILKKLNLTGGSEAKQLGSSSATTTDFWKRFGATNTTPKTDIIIGDKKISLKVGASQLISGAGAEMKATFMAALKNTPEISEELAQLLKDSVNTITKAIDTTFVRGTTKKGNVAQEKKRGDNPFLNKAVDEMNKLTKEIENLFKTNPEFKTQFALEAASGKEKFGGNLGTADYILSVKGDYTDAKIHKIDESYAKILADKMKIDINMKSNSEKINKIKTGQYNFYTVLRSHLKDLFNDSQDTKVNAIDVP